VEIKEGLDWQHARFVIAEIQPESAVKRGLWAAN